MQLKKKFDDIYGCDTGASTSQRAETNANTDGQSDDDYNQLEYQ